MRAPYLAFLALVSVTPAMAQNTGAGVGAGVLREATGRGAWRTYTFT